MPSATTKGIPYPVGADATNIPADMLSLANWLDPVLGSRTSAEITALAGAALWTGRRHYDTTLGVWRWYNGSAWVYDNILAVNAQVGTTYTFVLADANSKLVTLSNAAAITLTVPTNASVALPVGVVIPCCQLGAGQVTVAGAVGVTVNTTPGLKSRAQYSLFSLWQYAADSWLLAGDLSA